MLRTLKETDISHIDDILAARFGAQFSGLAREKCFERAHPRRKQDAVVYEKDGEVAGVAVVSGRYLRLLAVAPAFERDGIGTKLLQWSRDTAQSFGHETIIVAAEPGNYILPGIRHEDSVTIDWLTANGFERTQEYVNLYVDLSQVEASNIDDVVDIRKTDAKEVLDWIEQEFGIASAWEAERASRHDGLLAAFVGGRVVAFACHSANNVGMPWFGPAGTDPDYRGHGIGKALLTRTLIALREQGHSTGEIVWLGPREFYEKSVPVTGERSFIVFQGQTKPEAEANGD